MTLFAAGLGGLIELIFFLVFAGIFVINKILAARGEEEPGRRPAARPAPRPRPQQPQAGLNPMETKDVDQFLDEVLGPGRAARDLVPPAADPPVVVLRPSNPPPVPAARPRPEARRPAARTPARPARPSRSEARQARSEVRPPAPPPVKAKSEFAESIKKAVDQAAAATTEAAELKQVQTIMPTPTRHAMAAELSTVLRSPEQIRRAILIREILGPPVALRRRRI